MIVVGTIGFRYLEVALLALLVVATALLYLRRRPAELVLFSGLAVATLAFHLHLEEGRWQLVPSYVLLCAIALVLARPAGQPYRSVRPYRAAGLAVRIVATILVAAAVALPFLVPLIVPPPPAGPLHVGTITLVAPQDGATRRVRLWYPASAPAATVAPFWSADEIATRRLPGLPWFAATHLALAPTPAFVRAPVIADVRLPVVLAVTARDGLPGDFLHLSLEAASRGWIVIEHPEGRPIDEALSVVQMLVDGSIDAAFTGLPDPDRLAVILPDGVRSDAGYPTIAVAGDHVLEARLPSGTFAVDIPEALIPQPAFTLRALMMRPARFLVGGSDVEPARLHRLLRTAIATLLADGSRTAPVFSADPPVAEQLLAGTDGAVMRPLAAPPR